MKERQAEQAAEQRRRDDLAAAEAAAAAAEKKRRDDAAEAAEKKRRDDAAEAQRLQDLRDAAEVKKLADALAAAEILEQEEKIKQTMEAAKLRAWKCGVCQNDYLNEDPNSTSCVACGAPRPREGSPPIAHAASTVRPRSPAGAATFVGLTPTQVRPAAPVAGGAAAGTTRSEMLASAIEQAKHLSNQAHAHVGGWTCAICKPGTWNPNAATRCNACRAWPCANCTFNNVSTNRLCEICGSAAPNSSGV